MNRLILFVFCVALASGLKLTEVAEPVVDQYIIQFHQNVAENLRNEHMDDITAIANASILHRWDFPGFQGFAAEMGKEALEIALSRDDIILLVEQDGIMRTTEIDACVTQSGATWGITRTGQENPTTGGNYVHDPEEGSGYKAYIIDTGIYRAHSNFGGRAIYGNSFVNGETGDYDGNGHGTHVAGTVGSTTWGVSKSCTLVAVKVLGAGGSGTTSGVISGVNWVANDAIADAEEYFQKYGKKRSSKAAANMSLGGGKSDSLNNAVNAAVGNDIVFAVASGNNNNNACNYSPASAEQAISVNSMTSSDAKSSFSNYGTCSDVWGPGSSITSTWIGSTSATNTISGTSMASPHVCGVAIKLMTKFPAYDADKIKDELLSIALTNKLSGVPSNTPNRLVYAGCP